MIICVNVNITDKQTYAHGHMSMIMSAQFLQREYKKSMEQEMKGKGMLALATETPDFLRAKNATDILSQVHKSSPTHHFNVSMCCEGISSTISTNISTWIDTWICFELVFQAKYKQNAEHDRAIYTSVIDTPDILHAQQIRNIVSQVWGLLL